MNLRIGSGIDFHQLVDFENLKPEINTIFIDNKENLWLGGNNFIIKRD